MYIFFKKGVLSLLFLIFALSVFGNGTSEKQSDEGTRTRTISTDLGNVDVPIHPERVVVLDAMDNVLALGIKPVGASNWMGSASGEKAGFPTYLANEDLSDVTWLGDNKQPNLEMIMSLHPDIILGRMNRHEGIYDTLSAIAPTVLVDQKALGGWKGQFLAYGEALNKSAEAKELLIQYDKRTTNIAQKIKGLNRIPTVSVVRFDPNRIVIYEKKIFAGSVLNDAGILRPEYQDKDRKSEAISAEQIDLVDGDILITIQANQNTSILSKLKDNPLWSNLEAVKKDKVYNVSFDIWIGGWTITGANLILDDIESLLSIND
ncbi:ABC transporter substrate-binding protein [Spirochaeta cellobiosiphila]|uniref:ABC transporter substrate-binding protein n=1 Tax=Spirochaeta cellobiosiphila TaxID=504483 RepID=UPI00042332EF|nr:iron-siderophore ABC transporter substrate-binding protein [Spirochaeta cellobiosiphila]